MQKLSGYQDIVNKNTHAENKIQYFLFLSGCQDKVPSFPNVTELWRVDLRSIAMADELFTSNEINQ